MLCILTQKICIGIVITFPKCSVPHSCLVTRNRLLTFFTQKWGTFSYIIFILFIDYSMTPSKGFVMPPFNHVHMLRATRCFREAYTGLPVVRATENQQALNCVVLKYSIPVSEE